MANERRFAMAAPVALRSDYDAKALRRLAKASRDADQTRRLLAPAAIYDGGSRGDGAEIGGVGLQTVRDWVLRFNAEGLADNPDSSSARMARRRSSRMRRRWGTVIPRSSSIARSWLINAVRLDLAGHRRAGGRA